MRRDARFPALFAGRFPALRSVPLSLVLVPLAALVVVLPLLVGGCSCGHDFDFHLVSWFEAAAQFRAGVVIPHWAFSPGWNAGEPRFVFYPPLSWVLGALLGMVLPWAAVPVAYTWIALTAAGFGMYRLGGVVAGVGGTREGGALLAAMVYVANPYMIFTAYERTAYAELLAAAWIPLALAAVLRTRVTVLGLAVPVALLWLTNAPAAVMGCYAVGLVGVLRLIVDWRRDRAAAWGLGRRLVAGVGLGLGLAAFYVVPAAYERRWVEIAMVMVDGMRYGDNFLFHHTADAAHDEVLRTASWIAVGMLGATAVCLGVATAGIGRAGCREQGVGDRRAGIRGQGSGIRKGGLAALDTPPCGDETAARMGHPGVAAEAEPMSQKRDMGHPRLWIMLVVVAAMVGVLLTPVSAGVWRVAPELAFLQFPWRLLAVLAAVLGAGIALLAGRMRRGWAAALGLVLVAVLSWPLVQVFRQACDDEDTVQARLAVFQAKAGTDPTDEYTPKGADNDVLRHDDPPYWLGAEVDAGAPAGEKPGPVARRFTVTVPKDEVLVMNLRAYPTWRVRVNGVVVRPLGERADGLLTVAVPAGRDTVEVGWRATMDEIVGWGVSGVAVVVMGMVRLRRRR
jgi:hypothetical protein